MLAFSALCWLHFSVKRCLVSSEVSASSVLWKQATKWASSKHKLAHFSFTFYLKSLVWICCFCVHTAESYHLTFNGCSTVSSAWERTSVSVHTCGGGWRSLMIKTRCTNQKIRETDEFLSACSCLIDRWNYSRNASTLSAVQQRWRWDCC